MVECGFLESCTAVNAEGHSGGLPVAWNEAIFASEETCSGRFSATVELKQQGNGAETVFIPVYGPRNSMLCQSLWAELQGMAGKFQGLSALFGGNFHATLTAED